MVSVPHFLRSDPGLDGDADTSLLEGSGRTQRSFANVMIATAHSLSSTT